MTRTRGAALLLLTVFLVLPCGARLFGAARYDPTLRFHSLRTLHFVIHYHQGEEAHALRLARLAEEVHAALRPRLGSAPASRTHVVLVDQDDEPNGWATPVPYPLMELRLTPPPGSSFLGNTDDWLRMVFTHEYAHVLHLGQSRGWAVIPRRVFGRIPLAYPNLTLPLWQIEGLATWEESRDGLGRVHAGDFRSVVAEAARAGAVEPLDRVSGGLVAWPDGDGWYAYGAFFHEYLARRFGDERLRELSRRTAGRLPYVTSGAFTAVYGQSLGSLWRQFEREAVNGENDASPSITRQVTYDGYLVAGPRFDRDGTIVYSRQGPHDFPALMRIDPGTGRAVRVTSRYRGERTAVAADALYFDQLEVRRNVALTSDLYRWDRATGEVRRLTHGARLLDPDLSPDARRLVAVQLANGSRRLVLLDRAALDAGRHAQALERAAAVGGPLDIYATPRFSPDGRQIAAERRVENGPSTIVLVDASTHEVRPLITSDRGRNVTPAWSLDGESIFFASDRDGGPFAIYRARLTPDRRGVHSIERLPGPPGGAHSPAVSADGRSIAFVGYTVKGFDLFVAPVEQRDQQPSRTQGGAQDDDADVTELAPSYERGATDATAASAQRGAPAFASTGEQRPPAQAGSGSDSLATAPPQPYRPWSTLLPRSWLPVVQTDDEEVRLGAATAGSDALGYHAWSLTATWAAATDAALDPVVSRSRPDIEAVYVYDRWRPSIYAQYSDETTPFLVSRLTPDERPVALRERSLDLGMLLPVRRVRVSQSIVAAWHRERATIAGPFDAGRADRGAVRVGWGLQTARRYGYSISPEGGVALGMTAEAARPAFGADASAELWRVDARAYIPIGPRHAVLAARASGAGSFGAADARRVLRLGGTDPDGAVLSFDEDATSLLRGFPYATFRGTRVVLANVEYRIPLWYIERGIGTWPLFVRSVHGAGFFDAGHAWTSAFEVADLKQSWGAELSADVVLGYGLPLTWTAGIAWGRDGAGAVPDNRQVYARVGLAF